MSRSSQAAVCPKCLLLQATLALALLVVLCAPNKSIAQRRGGGFPGGMPGGGMHGAPMGGGFPRGGNVPPEMHRNNMRMHGSLQVGPPGRWWDDKHFAKQLKLSEDQQRHMDAIFEQSRPMLLSRLESLEREEQRMQALTHAKTLDEAALFTQIDRVAQARAELEKANTHLLFQIRNELDPDQIARLEEQQ